MLQRIQTALELIYPPRCLSCGALVVSDFGLCGACWRDTPFVSGTYCDACGVPLPGEPDGHRLECDDCMRTPRPWVKGRAALVYEGHARKLVLALKHGDRPEIARAAAVWLARAAQPMLKPDMLIVPIPLHWRRLVKRRYNQSALLAQAFARETGHPCCPDLLLRKSHTPPLDGKTAAQRFETVGRAIEVNPRHVHLVHNKPVLLVDDVMTSGATFSAATHAALAAGASQVFVLALARVAKAP